MFLFLPNRFSIFKGSPITDLNLVFNFKTWPLERDILCFWTEKSCNCSWLFWAPIWSKERKHSCSVPGFESLQLCQLMMLILLWFKQEYHLSKIYTTCSNGGDRFHLADTHLKPYLVGNICYMTYRYSVLYFLNLSLKHFFPQKTAIFVKIFKSGDRYRSVF